MDSQTSSPTVLPHSHQPPPHCSLKTSCILLRAFAFAIPPAWIALSPSIQMVHCLAFWRSFVVVILLLKKGCLVVFFLAFWLWLCLQHVHNDFLLLDKESTLDPVMNIVSRHGTTKGPADMFVHLRQLHRKVRSLLSMSVWVHTTHTFGAFLIFLV